MMSRLRRVSGFWAALLLALAVSPVTAPFSSCDLADFQSDRGLHDSPQLQTKPLKDASGVALATGLRPFVLPALTSPEIAAVVSHSGHHAIRHIPLRL